MTYYHVQERSMTYTTHDEKQIYYETFGNPKHPAVLMLHGIGADGGMFFPQIDAFLEAGWFVVVPDLRGHGRSSRTYYLDIADWIYDILELLDTIGIDTCTVIGVSMGGVIALELAAAHRDRLTSVVICDSFGEIASPAEHIIARVQIGGFRMLHHLPSKTAARAVSSIYRGISKEAEAYFKETALQADFRQFSRARRAASRTDVLTRISSPTLPMLVVAGTRMKILVTAGKKILRSVDGAKFAALPGGFYPSNITAPEAFNREVLAFLSSM